MNDRELNRLLETHANNSVDDDLTFFSLRESFPIKCHRAAFSDGIVYFIWIGLVFGLGLASTFGMHYFESSQVLFDISIIVWLSLSTVATFLWFCFYRSRFMLHKVSRYYIHNQTLRFRKGYFKKCLSSFKLTQITDVYTRQDWNHIPFGLCDLVVSTASAKSVKKAYVKSLPMKNALGMQKKILELVEEANVRKDGVVEAQLNLAKKRKESEVDFNHEWSDLTPNIPLGVGSYPAEGRLSQNI